MRSQRDDIAFNNGFVLVLGVDVKVEIIAALDGGHICNPEELDV